MHAFAQVFRQLCGKELSYLVAKCLLCRIEIEIHGDSAR
jgi:hypothetical protein